MLKYYIEEALENWSPNELCVVGASKGYFEAPINWPLDNKTSLNWPPPLNWPHTKAPLNWPRSGRILGSEPATSNVPKSGKTYNLILVDENEIR